MKLGFSLSPGGLLLPYHAGVLACLTQNGYITSETPLAGSSAGAIAVAAHAVDVNPYQVLDATIRLNSKCMDLGGARGRLMPLLEDELDALLPQDAHDIANEREGFVGLAFKEIFPVTRNVLKTSFYSREDFKEAVCNSSMFPFFTTNWPCALRTARYTSNLSDDNNCITAMSNDSNKDKQIAVNDSRIRDTLMNGYNNAALPRLVVDGYFTVPRDRFGCPSFPPESKVDRTITVSVFPHNSIGLTASKKHDRISPSSCDEDPSGQITKLLKRATQVSTKETCFSMFEEGCADAERWIGEELERNKMITYLDRR